MRRIRVWRPLPILAGVFLGAVSAGTGLPEWRAGGALVAGPPAAPDRAALIQDGRGGFFVSWAQVLPDSGKYLQVSHMNSDGSLAIGWPAYGRHPDPNGGVFYEALRPDGFGGAFAVRRRVGHEASACEVLRFAPDRVTPPGWPQEGITAVNGSVGPGIPGICADGSGGGFTAWQDFRVTYNDQNIYAQHIASDGGRPAGWPEEGAAVCLAPGDQYDPVLEPDGAGGMLVAWWDARAYDQTGFDIYAHRLLGDGTPAPGWPANGVAVCAAEGDQENPLILADGAGGGLIAWMNALEPEPNEPPPFSLGLQRLTAEGVAPSGWPENGLRIGRANGMSVPFLAGDGSGGAFLAWLFDDGLYPSVPGRTSVYVQHVGAEGTVTAGWPEAGRVLVEGPGLLRLIGLVPDGDGGVLAGIVDAAGGLRVLRVRGDGSLPPGWPVSGAALTTESVFSGLGLVTDGAGGAIAIWSARTSTGPSCLYAQRVTADGTVAPGWAGYPFRTRLLPAFPNPVRGSATIQFALLAPGPVDASILDASGRFVRTLVAGREFASGRHAVRWDGRGDDGRLTPAGVYVARVVGPGLSAAGRVVLLR